MKTIRKMLFMLPISAMILSSCNNFGKKVKVEGTKGEVYYKGEGVTEEDAKKTGAFLKDKFFTSDKESSTQLMKDGDGYILRFVYIKEVYDTLKGADEAFKRIGALLSKEVFGGKKVNIALTDRQFKDFKSIPYDATALETSSSSRTSVDYKHDSAGGVQFYWKDVSDEESKMIADYIVKNGAFAGGSAEIYISKEGDRYMLKFPMQQQYVNNPSYQAEVEKVSRQIKDNVFSGKAYSFAITDEQFNTVKQWDY